METIINERIAQLLHALGYRSKRAFALQIGIAQTSFNAILNGAEPKFSTLNRILTTHPTVSAEWLMRGEGEMLKGDAPAGVFELTREQLDYVADSVFALLRERMGAVNG